MIVMAWLFLGGLSPAQTRTGPHDPEKDKQAVVALEDQWPHAKNPATLDRILATEFVHVVPADHFLNKQQHIDCSPRIRRLSRVTRNSASLKWGSMATSRS
jgi:hypothetical protein